MFTLEGIVPPMVTPLHADETIDVGALERQLERLITAGVHGIFFLGSTGEQPALRESERDKAIRAAVKTAAGRVPIIVGTMAGSSARAIDNIRQAEAAGADAVAVTPPHYYPSRGEEEQFAHYKACAATTGLPVVIYNIPSTTKVQMAPETIARIGEIGNVVGVKDSSADFVHFLKILSLCRGMSTFSVMIGAPALAGAAVLYGGSGAVPGIANIDPETMLEVYSAAKRAGTPTLQRLQDRVQKLLAIGNFGTPLVCFKTALELMGICSAHATAPLQPLSPEKREAIAAILRELELL